MIYIKVKLKNGSIFHHYRVKGYSLQNDTFIIENFVPPSTHYYIANVASVSIDIMFPTHIKNMSVE